MLAKGTPADLTKETPFFDNHPNLAKAISPQKAATLKANLNVAKTGASDSKNRALYEYYTPKSMVEAGPILGQKSKFATAVAEEMVKESQRILAPDQVMVMSRVHESGWRYVNQEQHTHRMLKALRLENGGRAIANSKQEKYSKKTFNYNDD